MNVLTIIPARGGSKGVPGKNKALIDGKPLIAYTIETALKSNLPGYLVVSSDDDEILEIAKRYDGVLIHKRGGNLASDVSPITDTIKELSEKYPSDLILLLQPTSPIRDPKHVIDSIRKLEKKSEANSVISVTAMDDIHPARMYWEKEDGMHSILPEFEKTRRQEIPPALYRNGAIYLVRTKAFKETGQIMVKPALPLKMPSAYLLNIDEPRDLLIAEVLIKAWKNGELK